MPVPAGRPRRERPRSYRVAPTGPSARGTKAAGASCRGIGQRLGVSAESIRRWTVRPPVRDGGSELVPVRLVAEAAGRLTIWSPAGYRVEGLSIAEAAELLRKLV